jgi:protein tyrosine phosphatase (PTP) superfamily phosphohydrolase (DUF442 family)
MKALKILGIAAGSILAIVIAAGTFHYYQSEINYRFTAVTEGRVYRSGAMPHELLIERTERYGIRSVVDLQAKNAQPEAERAALEAVGVRYFHVPAGQIPSEAAVDRFLEVMSDESNYPVLVHCTHGEGRAPLFSAIYRIEFEGWEPEEARRKARWFADFSGFEESGDKGGYLVGYDLRRKPASQTDSGDDPVSATPKDAEGSATD